MSELQRVTAFLDERLRTREAAGDFDANGVAAIRVARERITLLLTTLDPSLRTEAVWQLGMLVRETGMDAGVPLCGPRYRDPVADGDGIRW